MERVHSFQTRSFVLTMAANRGGSDTDRFLAENSEGHIQWLTLYMGILTLH